MFILLELCDYFMNMLSTETPTAFISVYDKTGLEPLAKALVDVYGYTLLSTGGTYTFLTEKGIPAIESSTVTGFNDLLEGRVKSLHPHIFAGILAKRNNPKHMTDALPFTLDTVVVNLYPFEAASQDEQAKTDPTFVLDYIDIGGPSLIRAAAKNHPDVNVLVNPTQYDVFLQELKLGDGVSSLPFRQKLAVEAFQQTAAYDAIIQAHLAKLFQLPGPALAPLLPHTSPQANTEAPATTPLPETFPLSLIKTSDLRYGENPHQHAALYRWENGTSAGESDTQFQGKSLSYNNILDMEAAWSIVTEFTDRPACAIIKHNNPCGVALGNTVTQAYERALSCDPISAFGGIVAFNAPVDATVAKQLKELFLEVVIAPGFTPDALALFEPKKNLRVIARQPKASVDSAPLDVRQAGATTFLVQQDSRSAEAREHELAAAQLQILTKDKPSTEHLADMIFAWKVVKHVKSNGIVLAKDLRTVGIGVGQTSRIGALELAIRQACDEAKDAVMASDGFLPAEDNIHAAVQARIGAIIQPGGSIKDEAVVALANQYHLPMVATGVRVFLH